MIQKYNQALKKESQYSDQIQLSKIVERMRLIVLKTKMEKVYAPLIWITQRILNGKTNTFNDYVEKSFDRLGNEESLQRGVIKLCKIVQTMQIKDLDEESEDNDTLLQSVLKYTDKNGSKQLEEKHVKLELEVNDALQREEEERKLEEQRRKKREMEIEQKRKQKEAEDLRRRQEMERLARDLALKSLDEMVKSV